MSWVRVLETEVECFTRGTVFRFPAAYPYEEVVDFLVADVAEGSGHLFLVVASGYKAGLTALRVPKEAISSQMFGIDRSWLLGNWTKWVYPGCALEDVWMIHHYPAPELPNNN